MEQTISSEERTLSESLAVLEKTAKNGLLHRTIKQIKRLLGAPHQRLINSYYCKHPIHFYTHIEKLSSKGHASGYYAPMIQVPTIIGDLFFVTDPVLIKTLLKHPRLDQGEFLSEGRQLRVIAEALGKLRLNQQTSDMKPKRSVLTTLLMHPERYLPLMFDIADELVAKWREERESLTITKDISEFAVKIFLKPIMNYEGPYAPIVAILEEQIDLLGQRLIYRKPANFNQRFIELRNELMKYLYPSQQPTMSSSQYAENLSNYINQHHKAKEQEAFATGVNSGTLAGYLAPYPAFIAIVYELGKHPEWQNKVKVEWEIAQAQGQSREDYIKSEDTLLHATIHEILRLHPPQPFLFRDVAQDFMINKRYHLHKGGKVVINLYHSLKDVRTWGRDAAVFNPMRFIQDPSLYLKPFLAYSTGPNNCTGQMFSRQTMKILLQTLCAHLQWTTKNKLVNHRFHFALNFDEDVIIQLMTR